MPRTWDTDFQNIFEAYKLRHTLDLYLADDSILHLSRGRVVRTIDDEEVEYQNYIRSVEDLTFSLTDSIDRISIKCQNVNSELGFNLAANLRLLDFALADYGKIYQSVRNPELIQDIPQMFRGVLANGEADEKNFNFELIVDYAALGNIIASRWLSFRCLWTYKNGIECNSASVSDTCAHTRKACKKNLYEFGFGGFEDFDEPVSSAPGTGTGGGGIGGPCFTGDTLIWTPKGSIPIGEMENRIKRGEKSVFSFDPHTGEIIEDEITEVLKHEVAGYFTFDFEHASLNVTREHRLFTGNGDFVSADMFRRNDTVRSFIDSWFDSKLKKIRWHSDKKTTVYNLHVRQNHTYFANECGVHNAKGGGNEIILV